MTLFDVLILVYFVVVIGAMTAFLAMEKRWWRPLLILAVLPLFLVMMWLPGHYTPAERLKPGIDLAGGTTLVYEVDGDAEAVEQAIAVYQNRVDPTGTRNLIWRRVGDNRFEVQMAAPSKDVKELQQTYEDKQQELLENNITPEDLDNLLDMRTAEARLAEIDDLAGANDHRRELLEQLITAHEQFTAAREPYVEAQAVHREAERRLRRLGEEAEEGRREELQKQVRAALAELTPATEQFLDARQRLQALRDQVLETNVAEEELRSAKTLADRVVEGKVDDATFEEAVDRLVADHPESESEIRAMMQAYRQFAEKKGPLDDANDLKALLRGAGVLEFRIAPAPGEVVDVDSYREQLTELGPNAGLNREFVWLPIDDINSFVERPQDRQQLEEDYRAYFASRDLVAHQYGGEYYILLYNTPDMSITEAKDDWELTNASPTQDQNGFAAVAFELNSIGGRYMSDLTQRNGPQDGRPGKPMGIILDGRLISAPTIQATIGSSGIITGGRGGFSQQELVYLVQTLNAGSLAARVSQEPVMQITTGPTLGEANRESGKRAAVSALILVAVFMLIYYLFGGLVADFALFANIVIILGTMAMFDATFTLPGIAGIVLTIGMAVDANVLIFERIREEIERKTEIETAVRLGYQRALSTILDANITTLITCWILLGCPPFEVFNIPAAVKGFATTLMIGILATLFTSLFCTRVIFELWLRYVKPKTLHMLPTMVGVIRNFLSPNVNWVSLKYIFAGVSAVAMLVSVIVIVSRGGDLLDIEFRGGTQVVFDLAEGEALTEAQVAERLNQIGQQENIVELTYEKRPTIVTIGDTTTVENDEGQAVPAATAFSVSTLAQDERAVSDAVKVAFEDVLDQGLSRRVDFTGAGEVDAPDVEQSPVYRLLTRQIGDSIDRPDFVAPAGNYFGGVAIVIEDLDPALTLDEIRDRIDRTANRPPHNEKTFRDNKVLGLDPADEGEGKFRSVVVVAADETTNYVEDPEAFGAPQGLAVSSWELIHDSFRRDSSLRGVMKFSSQVSASMQAQAIGAIVLSLIAVVGYIWLRFGSLRYGFAAIAALVHDVTITLGLVALAGLAVAASVAPTLTDAMLLYDFKIDLALIAAILTIVGYSLNDTIVVFDRVRENKGKLPLPTVGIVNDSINQVFSRTIITSLTTLLALLTLYTQGGRGVHGFGFTMLVGVIVGTYSSVGIAAPLVLIGRGESKKAPVEPETAPATT